MVDYEITPRILEFKEPAGTSRGVYTKRKIWIVTVTDKETGEQGFGECAPLPDLCPDPSCAFKMAVETAQWSLAAVKAGRTPWQLFDTPFANGKSGIPINGLVWMGDYEKMQQRVIEKVNAGFRCIKFKIGAIDWKNEVQLIHDLRQDFPAKDMEIRLDANGAFAPEEALGKLEELARYDIYSIEQPIRAGQWKAMAEICRNSPLSIALDEELIQTENQESMLDEIMPQYIILKPSLHGAFSGCERWIRHAEERGIDWWATSALESNVGLNAIAQWVSTHDTKGRPQGLGTGQLFVENVNGPKVAIRDTQVWCEK